MQYYLHSLINNHVSEHASNDAMPDILHTCMTLMLKGSSWVPEVMHRIRYSRKSGSDLRSSTIDQRPDYWQTLNPGEARSRYDFAAMAWRSTSLCYSASNITIATMFSMSA